MIGVGRVPITAPGFAPVQDNGTETNYTTTAWTVVGGLSIPIVVAGPSEVYRVDALIDLAAYAANTATIVWNLTIDGAGHPVTFPLRVPVENMRDSVPCSWVLDDLDPGEHVLGLAAYMTGTGNYQAGSGTTMIVQRIV